MEYKIVIFDSQSKELIMDNASVSYLGLKEILKNMTDMNQREYKSVINKAWSTGSTTYIPSDHDEKQFSIAIVRVAEGATP